jgi:acylphosphatase
LVKAALGLSRQFGRNRIDARHVWCALGRTVPARKALRLMVQLWLDFAVKDGTARERFGNFFRELLVKRSRMHIYYSGKVQGVGFRYTTKSTAAGFEVIGVVRNLADGRVELIAEGIKEELEAFRTAILDSGLKRFISNEQIAWEDAKGEFRGFEIRS